MIDFRKLKTEVPTNAHLSREYDAHLPGNVRLHPVSTDVTCIAEGIDAVLDSFDAVIIQAPTGFGKTYFILHEVLPRVKAIRQALENKVILLSRETHPTLPETTSLAVGYYLPNDRAEVTNLMSDFKIAYGYNIGIMDLKTLLTIAVTIICDGKTFDIAELNRLEGFANATFN